MRPPCFLIRRFNYPPQIYLQRRTLLTLAIETSCDDTSVAVLEKHSNNSATLHFNEKITSDNRAFGGVHPIEAHVSHQRTISGLVNRALQSLPFAEPNQSFDVILVNDKHGASPRQKPDFVTVTRGPGMRASLITGIDTAKGLAVAWQIPLLGVNHMQGHALTPRLVSALEPDGDKKENPEFPFLTLLVSGGHTMLVHSKSLSNHEILANTKDLAIGDMIDKCARDILPPLWLEGATDVMFGRLLEKFAFSKIEPEFKYESPKTFGTPRQEVGQIYDWKILPPFTSPGPEGARKWADTFTYSGIGTSVKRIVERFPAMDDKERCVLAKVTMMVAFEHLASRVLFALQKPEIKVNTLVVSGGVASNQFLKHILRTILDTNGHKDIRLLFPPPYLCTDNAAMIAWTGMEMYEAGWRTSLEAMAIRKWAIDPKADDGGILGVDGWERNDLQ
ncbi:related to QRI7-similarity to H.influenzae sialoglycoprotease (gcp) [Rhynchosporium agropyri]|uniref:N(6)-L-threonylcarbamoyladenine synthase n=1 Tax=Rhynchosporium agropyri TaxID=914238 RepID=A0A1E1L6N8_9HELO|nr:related to QRI7-similarity to H.influenzae sialoglycoprotease (gcp) [Rhynchosporium agropyri]